MFTFLRTVNKMVRFSCLKNNELIYMGGMAIKRNYSKNIALSEEEINNECNNVDVELQSSIYENGRYRNPWKTFDTPPDKKSQKTNFTSVARLVFSKRSNELDPKKVLDIKLPVVKPDWRMPKEGINFTWLGHSSVAAQFDDITILADPIFNERCSAVSFFGPKRYRPAPCTVSELPKIDAVVISHTHYDHLDLYTVKQLNARFGDQLYWFVPIGSRDWFVATNCRNVIELDWWQSARIPGKSKIEFVFTPTRHWCKRTPFDDNKSLWGSWSVIGHKHRFFFTGDTAYCEGFKQIGMKYGPFDVAAIPIGVYEPRWIMKKGHVNPEEAVLIHQDLKSKLSVGIHWGTFALSFEHYLDPPKHLKRYLSLKNIPEREFITLKHGESKVITNN